MKIKKRIRDFYLKLTNFLASPITMLSSAGALLVVFTLRAIFWKNHIMLGVETLVMTIIWCGVLSSSWKIRRRLQKQVNAKNNLLWGMWEQRRENQRDILELTFKNQVLRRQVYDLKERLARYENTEIKELPDSP